MAIVRDAEGHVTSLPHAERAVASCLEAIRRERAARGAAGMRLDTGDYIVAPVWIDPKDLSRVAVDVTAGQIEHSPAD